MLLEFRNAILKSARGNDNKPDVVYLELIPQEEDGKAFKLTLENCSPSEWMSLPMLPFTFVFKGQFSVYSNGSGKDRSDSVSFKAESGTFHDPYNFRAYIAQVEAKAAKQNGG